MFVESIGTYAGRFGGPVTGTLGLRRLRNEAHLAADALAVLHVVDDVLVAGLHVSLRRLLASLPRLVHLVAGANRQLVVLDLKFLCGVSRGYVVVL